MLLKIVSTLAFACHVCAKPLFGSDPSQLTNNVDIPSSSNHKLFAFSQMSHSSVITNADYAYAELLESSGLTHRLNLDVLPHGDLFIDSVKEDNDSVLVFKGSHGQTFTLQSFKVSLLFSLNVASHDNRELIIKGFNKDGAMVAFQNEFLRFDVPRKLVTLSADFRSIFEMKVNVKYMHMNESEIYTGWFTIESLKYHRDLTSAIGFVNSFDSAQKRKMAKN
eukprot:Awhi_evm1s11109